jgi:hypothetical protein
VSIYYVHRPLRSSTTGLPGLSPPEQEKPPPRREVVRVPVDDEGREILAG